MTCKVMGQQMECGTQITPAQERYLQSTLEQRQSYRIPLKKKIANVPVRIYIIRNTDGTGGLDTASILKELDTVNYFYQNAGIRFFMCDSFHYIDDDQYVPFYSSQESKLAVKYYKPGVLNIYFAPGLYNAPSLSICGYSKFPPSEDRIFINDLCATNGSTLAHEIGHYFSLFHTHHPLFGLEYVDGSNCLVAGDLICDTPADPNLQGKVTSSCVYIGTDVDPNGDAYKPQIGNIMSYSRKECRNIFTQEQYQAIAYSMENDRFYLDCCPKPVAKFGYYYFPSDPLKYYFVDSSILNANTVWYFGDGDSSTIKNSVKTFSHKGNYKITLVAKNECGIDTFSDSIIAGAALSINNNTAPSFKLHIFPNPFYSQFQMNLTLPFGDLISITLLSLTGQEKDLITNQYFGPGSHELEFMPAKEEKGIYFLKVRTSKTLIIRKVVKLD